MLFPVVSCMASSGTAAITPNSCHFVSRCCCVVLGRFGWNETNNNFDLFVCARVCRCSAGTTARGTPARCRAPGTGSTSCQVREGQAVDGKDRLFTRGQRRSMRQQAHLSFGPCVCVRMCVCFYVFACLCLCLSVQLCVCGAVLTAVRAVWL